MGSTVRDGRDAICVIVLKSQNLVLTPWLKAESCVLRVLYFNQKATMIFLEHPAWRTLCELWFVSPLTHCHKYWSRW